MTIVMHDLAGADPAQLSAMMKSAQPFWEFFGTMRMRLLQNVDDPGRFIQAWRSMLPGAVEIDVYEEV